MFTRFFNQQKKHNEKAFQDPYDYLKNPINSFQITKRLTVDWPQFEKIIINDQSFGKIVNLKLFILTTLLFLNIFLEFLQNLTSLKVHLRFPSLEDLNGAAEALARLQNLYQLNATTVAKGLISGATNR